MVDRQQTREIEVLVCYDVEDNRRRRLLGEALLDIGLIRIQKSVFWGLLRPADERAVKREFDRLLEKDTDRAFLARTRLSGADNEAVFGRMPSEVLDNHPGHVFFDG